MNKPGYEKPDDMLQWLMDERVKRHWFDMDYEYQADAQLFLAFASVNTTTTTIVHMLYDLAAMPEYQEIIRQELEEELAKNDGAWDLALMRSLKKTDSFMKESQRHNPVTFGELLKLKWLT